MTKIRIAALAVACLFCLAAGESRAAEFNPEATALPFPPDAQGLEFSDWPGRVRFTSQSHPDSLIEFYSYELPRRGWGGNVKGESSSEGDHSLTFSHDKTELNVEFKVKRGAKDVEVEIRSKALKFTGVDDPAKLAAAGIPVPRSALYLQKELPLPANVQGLHYSASGSTFKSTLALQEAFDHFTRALQAKGFKESRKPIQNDTRRYTEFKKGTVQVSVNVFSDAVGSRIVLEHKDETKEAVKPPLPPAIGGATTRGGRGSSTEKDPATPASETKSTGKGEVAAVAGIDVKANKGSASITYAGKQYTFPHVASFQTKTGAATVVFSSQPIPFAKMQAMLAAKDGFSFGDLYENGAPDRLQIQPGENPSFTFALPNVYVGDSVDNSVSDIKADAGRIKGSLKMPAKEVFKGQALSFTVTVDAAILTPATRIAGEK